MKYSIFKDSATKDKYSQSQKKYWDGVEKLVESSGLSLRECFTNYQAFIQRRHLPKTLAYYELFKMIQDIPGSIVELGVFRGAGLFSWSHLLETFCPGDCLRRVYGFDHFEGYQNFQEEDGALKSYFEDALGGNYMDSSYEFIMNLQDLHDEDSYFPGVKRTEIISGDVTKTIPQFVIDAPGVRLSMLYIDVNLYDPVKTALDSMYDLVLEGGIVAFSGYSASPWEGEANAVETFFNERGLSQPKMQQFPWSPIPRAYFVKSDFAHDLPAD